MIAVLMACYNSERTLLKTIDSLKKNDLPYRLFIVDDASEPPVRIAITGQQNVELIRLDRNVGLTRALNVGVKRILEGDYEYIARIDADDVSIQHRLDKQVEYLEAHPDIDCLGTWARFIDEDSGELAFLYRPPAEPSEVAKALRFNSCVAHPSWMVRASTFRRIGLYDESVAVAQDYEFLMRMLSKKLGIANLSEPLLDYTISVNGISTKKRTAQLISRIRSQCRYFDFLEYRSYAGLTLSVFRLFAPLSFVRFIKKSVWKSSPA